MSAAYDRIALKLQLSPAELQQESLRLFLRHRLRLIESQLMNLMRRYGVQTLAEFDQQVQSGRVREVDAFEDYFEFDFLESERDALLDSLKELG